MQEKREVPQNLKGLNFGHLKFDEENGTWEAYPNREAYKAYLNWNPKPTFKRYHDFALIDHNKELAIDMRSEERKQAEQEDTYPLFL